MDETIVRARPGTPTPRPDRRAPVPPPLPPRPVVGPPAASDASAGPLAAETVAESAPAMAPGEAPADAPIPPDPVPELEPEPMSPALAPAAGEPVPYAAPEIARLPSAEALEEADRAGALDAGPPRRRSWLWAVAATGAIGLLLGGLALSLARPPSTGRVVLDVSPPEARGRVRLTVGGADLGVPTRFPVVQAVPVGKVEILASADGFKPALVEANVRAGDGTTSVMVPLQHAATVARFTVLPEPDDAEVRLDGQVVKRSGSARALRRRADSRRRSTPSRCGAPDTGRPRSR